MKTAISVPDVIFKSADALAKRLGMSRSRLYATAIAEYVAKHRDAKVTERLNAVYGDEANKPDPVLRTVGRRSAKRSEW